MFSNVRWLEHVHRHKATSFHVPVCAADDFTSAPVTI